MSEITEVREMYIKVMPKTCIYCEKPEHFGLMPEAKKYPYKESEGKFASWQHWHFETEESAYDKKNPKRIRCQKDTV
jgi:hypothetical protein